jgi:hypothetical protein
MCYYSSRVEHRCLEDGSCTHEQVYKCNCLPHSLLCVFSILLSVYLLSFLAFHLITAMSLIDATLGLMLPPAGAFFEVSCHIYLASIKGLATFLKVLKHSSSIVTSDFVLLLTHMDAGYANPLHLATESLRAMLSIMYREVQAEIGGYSRPKIHKPLIYPNAETVRSRTHINEAYYSFLRYSSPPQARRRSAACSAVMSRCGSASIS